MEECTPVSHVPLQKHIVSASVHNCRGFPTIIWAFPIAVLVVNEHIKGEGNGALGTFNTLRHTLASLPSRISPSISISTVAAEMNRALAHYIYYVLCIIILVGTLTVIICD